MTYRPRVIDTDLDDLFPHLAAIALEGAKGVGKTATATRRAESVFTLTDPVQRTSLMADLDLVTRVKPPVLVDEWQLEPAVWERIRRAVDDDSSGGRFLLAGSAGVDPGVRIHSGAGRIVRLKMRPLSIAERGLGDCPVSLRDLLEGHEPGISGESPLTLGDYTDEILRSGFPGIRDLPERPRTVQLDSYLDRIVEHDLRENGINVRRPAALRAWMGAYAAATATDASYTSILDAATPGEGDKPSRQTVAIYRDHLERIFIFDPIPAWTPGLSPLRRLARSPKHHLVDPAFAARLIGIGKEGLLRGEGTGGESGVTWLGRLFESLVTQSVRVYADSIGARTGHLRTRDTRHEIDLVVEREDRSCLAIEIKLGGTVGDADVRHLNWLARELEGAVLDRLVLYTGRYAYRRPDGVAVVPLALLGP